MAANPGDHPPTMQIANPVRQRLAARSHSPATRHRAPRRRAPRPGCRRPEGAASWQRPAQPAQQLRRLEQRQADDIGIAAGQEADEQSRPAPGWRSRRPCRAIPRWRGSRRSGARSGARTRPRSAPAARRGFRRGHRSTTAVITRWRRPDSSAGSAARLPRSRPWAGCADRRRPRCRRPARSSRVRRPRSPSRAPGAGACCRGSSSRSGVSSMSGGDHAVRHDADLRQKREAPRAGGSQNQRRRGHLKRKVIRPLLKS